MSALPSDRLAASPLQTLLALAAVIVIAAGMKAAAGLLIPFLLWSVLALMLNFLPRQSRKVKISKRAVNPETYCLVCVGFCCST